MWAAGGVIKIVVWEVQVQRQLKRGSNGAGNGEAEACKQMEEGAAERWRGLQKEVI